MSLKILINNEEVVCNSNIQIKEEMLSTSSTILKNCYPKSWENDKDYTSRYYFPKDYSKCKIIGGQQTRTGTSFSFRNAYDYFDYKLLGETGGITGLQNIEVCGKNLFNSSVITNSKITISEDGTLNVSDVGGANGYCETGKTLSQLCPNLKVGDIVYLYIDTDFYYNDSKRDLIYCRGNWTNGTSKTITQAMLDGIVVIYGGYQTTSHIKIMITKQLETTYEPYTGNTYEVNLGKNLFDNSIINDTTKNGLTLTNTNGLIKITGTSTGTTTFNYRCNLSGKVKVGKTYTLSVQGDMSNISNIGFKKSGTDYIVVTPSNPKKTIVMTQSIIDNVNEINIFISGIKTIDASFNIQLELGDTQTEYSSYFTPIVLNQGDYIYKENTWKTYINGVSTDITNDDLIIQLNSIKLLNGINNINSTCNLELLFSILVFCGCIKNTGNISLNPREPHFVDLQVLDFKTLLSEGETLNYVITGKTIVEAINQVVNSISSYGFVVGNIQLLNPDEMIGAYSTLNKTAYDVFQYFADITQSRWTTRMIDENTIAIDFYDPTLMPQADPIMNTKEYMCSNKIDDISFNYSTNDYRNKQIMTSDEIIANITQTNTIVADGYSTNFTCENKIGTITNMKVNGVNATFITKSEEELGLTATFVYQPGENNFNSSSTLLAGSIIAITYYPIVKGREIILNSGESTRINEQINRNGNISRYENRQDATSSAELQKIGQSYIKYKGKAEINLKVKSEIDLFNVGQIVEYQAPLEELATDYMVKSKTIDWYVIPDKIFYTYELTSNFNYENAVNYFDNQRAKNQGNIGEGQTITRNIDLEATALIKFYDTEVEEIEVLNPTSLDFALDGVII